MALTVTPVREHVTGDRLQLIADVTFDASYTTGGLALTPAVLGMWQLDFVSAPSGTAGNSFSYDYTNQKLLAFSGAAEVANAANIATVKTRIVAKGKGFPITGA